MSYRQFLRWNDELPFVKFAVTEDERPVLTLETAADGLSLDDVGRLLARSLAIADLIHDQALALMGELRRRHAKLIEDQPEPDPSGVALLDRYANEVAELLPVADDYLSTGPGTTGQLGRPSQENTERRRWSPCFMFAGLKPMRLMSREMAVEMAVWFDMSVGKAAPMPAR